MLPTKNHPNYRLWANYARFARDRGGLVTDIIADFAVIPGLEVLDIGCGAGGTSIALAEAGARVTAIDFDETRVRQLCQFIASGNWEIEALKGNAHNLDFDSEIFDCVILQDVIEHLPSPHKAIAEITRVLKPTGLIYISTPNRWSPLNFISDPHWNLPMVSVLPRKAVAFYITKIIRREQLVREDFAALFSLQKVKQIFVQAGIEIALVNSKVARSLFNNPTSVVNSDFHLAAVKRLRAARIDKLLCWLVNDRFGIFNYLVNPTWYFVGRKKLNLVQDSA